MTTSRSALRIAAASFGSMSIPAWPTYDGWRLSRWSWRRNAVAMGMSNASRELGDMRRRLRAPTAAAEQQQRPLGSLSLALRRVISLLEGASAVRLCRRCVGSFGVGKQHILRQAKHHGARGVRSVPPWKARATNSGNALGLAHDADPIRRPRRTWPPGRFPERRRVPRWHARSARRGAPWGLRRGGRHTPRSRRWWRPGARVTKATPGCPVSLPVASAIIAAPPSWRQTMVRIEAASNSASSAAMKLSPGTVNSVRQPSPTSWSIRILPPVRITNASRNLAVSEFHGLF